MGDRGDAAFLAAVLAKPDDPLPRLLFADHLDETAVTVPCGRCNGKGGRMNPTGGYREFSGAYPRWEDCPTCRGTGGVSDGRAERAEFIRVQCELARPEPPLPPECVVGDCPVACELCTARHRRDALRARERELQIAHAAAWRRREFGTLADRMFGLLGPDSLRSAAMINVCYSRGFIESLTLAAADWLAHADQLAAATPVRSVTLTTWPQLRLSDVQPPTTVALMGRRRLDVWANICETWGELTARLLAAEWPGVKFSLPAAGRADDRPGRLFGGIGREWRHP